MSRFFSFVALLLAAVCGLSSCGANQDSQIVGLTISPPSAATVVGSGADFSAAVQYVDGHTKLVSNVKWSIQRSATLISGTFADGSVSVSCVRRSDYFAGGCVGDTIMGQAEISGQTYIETASLTCE